MDKIYHEPNRRKNMAAQKVLYAKIPTHLYYSIVILAGLIVFLSAVYEINETGINTVSIVPIIGSLLLLIAVYYELYISDTTIIVLTPVRVGVILSAVLFMSIRILTLLI